MTAVAITAFNVLLIMAIWKFILRKTILDHHRDKLFDLRSEVRRYFFARKSLSHPIYKEVRKLINAEIAMTENISLSGYIIWVNAIDANKELHMSVREDIDARFRCNDKELNDYINSVRSRASDICVSYLVSSSFWMLTMVTIVGFFASFAQAFCALRDKTVSIRRQAVSVTASKMFSTKTLEEASLISI